MVHQYFAGKSLQDCIIYQRTDTKKKTGYNEAIRMSVIVKWLITVENQTSLEK
eukprot:TRINITY_DN7152_c0_g1_i1.p2 TRINITY_DN7152_c0_g1~~TRINITY_DN7152_c0_g1_i1.p2  ORF type:complete len:53 (+),score=1.39 TRINITY_DN7152_c0_g1_i1:416-574(+)